MAPDLQDLAEAFERARQDRVQGDYDLGGAFGSDTAAEVARDAEDFVERCFTRWPLKS